MTAYIGYVRVSTVKQGTKGVSLQEQRDAIVHYAERNHLSIATWFEETETAAKQGRPVFAQALKMLRNGQAGGIILHKLDRGARNLKDWAAIGELSDQGIEVHFVTESLDLQSRGGRLSADIQAVVAADYIRNLREETRKGFYGRLKQGLYPLRAPLGYLDQGKGKAKTIDPMMGPIVRKAFELYASATFNLDTLGAALHRLGLRNRNGRNVTRNGISTILNNSFYFGLIEIQKTGECFVGIHEPLITKSLFDRVQSVLKGKVNSRLQRHSFHFRRLLACSTCRYSLIGERQKGHVYYRCHSRQCPRASIREDQAQTVVEQFFRRIQFNEAEKAYFRFKVASMRKTWASRRDEEANSLNLKLKWIKDRLNRLADAYLDQAFDKSMFDEHKKSLLLEQKSVEESLEALSRKDAAPDRLEKFLELASDAWLSHQIALPEERRDMVKICTSNREVRQKRLELKPSIAFQEIVGRSQTTHCDPHRDIPRTWDRILNTLARLNATGELPDLSQVAGFLKPRDKTDQMTEVRDKSVNN
jgi:site-specific DNA recombinase